MVSGTLCLVRGDDQTIGLTVYQSDGVTVYDLTGCTLTLTVRRNTYFSSVIFTVVTTVHSDPTAGVSSFLLVPADTANMDDEPYFFSITLLDTAAKTTTLMTGTLDIQPT